MERYKRRRRQTINTTRFPRIWYVGGADYINVAVVSMQHREKGTFQWNGKYFTPGHPYLYTQPPISTDDKQKPKLTIIIKLQMKFLSMAKKRNNDTTTNSVDHLSSYFGFCSGFHLCIHVRPNRTEPNRTEPLLAIWTHQTTPFLFPCQLEICDMFV